MGGGSYSHSARDSRAATKGYHTKSRQEIFDQRSINSAMNPFGVKIRESRDSKEHPESLAIMLGLDITGSMGSVPDYLVKNGLPHLIERIIKGGIKHPQVLFAGIGDHDCGDKAPLQVGQFESSDELLDKWLTTIYLEGGGGANIGESYLLAWYFAAYHTALDCFEKRKQKGFLFTIGDEPVLPEITAHRLKQLMGEGQYETFSALQLLDKAREKYHVFHVHIAETGAGSRKTTVDGWTQLLRDDLLIAQNHADVSRLISDKVVQLTKGQTTVAPETTGEKTTGVKETPML